MMLKFHEILQLADNGDSYAQCELAALLESSANDPSRYEEAAHYWRLAAENGSVRAMLRIAELCDLELIIHDDEEGQLWRRKAAKKGLHSGSSDIRNNDSQSQDQRKKVLILEDDPDIQDWLHELLAEEGFDTVKANNGIEGIDAIKNNHDIKLLLVDLAMPKMGGLEFIQYLADHNLLNEIPIIIATGSFKTKEHDHIERQLMVSSWLVKPFESEKFIRLVHRFVS